MVPFKTQLPPDHGEGPRFMLLPLAHREALQVCPRAPEVFMALETLTADIGVHSHSHSFSSQSEQGCPLEVEGERFSVMLSSPNLMPLFL